MELSLLSPHSGALEWKEFNPLKIKKHKKRKWRDSSERDTEFNGKEKDTYSAMKVPRQGSHVLLKRRVEEKVWRPEVRRLGSDL